jgi:hypothetical protein
MGRYVTISKTNIDEYLERYAVIVFALRNSRIKAKQLAVMEAYIALSSVGGIFICNGPLGDVKGLFSFFVPAQRLDELRDTLPGIGYCHRFYLLDFHRALSEPPAEIATINELVWKGRRFAITPFFIQDPALYEAQSPHNREFKILTHGLEEKIVHGYRGDGTETGRRALPVEDARCMVNLSDPYTATRLLDPFAGGGGIVYQAKYINNALEVYSVDIDPVLAPGLRMYGSRHYVGDAGLIHFRDERFDAIVTEVPFAPGATDRVLQAIGHLAGYLQEDGNMVLMSSVEQAVQIDPFVRDIGFHRYVFQPINRKGTDVAIMAWSKSREKVEQMRDFLEIVHKIR